MKTYLGAFLFSMFIAGLATPLIVRLARRLGALDKPGGRKIHSKTIPRLGGLAIALGFLGTLVAIWFLRNQVSNLLYHDTFRLFMVLFAAMIMLALGVVDDLRGLRAKHKLFVEIIIALVLCSLDIRIMYLNLPGLFEIHFGWWSWPLTVIWIVGITNAMNLIDGLDGLAAGIAAITCAPIAVFALASGQMLAACVMLALLGALLGFLIHNFNPAKIFLGDSGSLFVGFLLASLSVYCSVKAPMAVGLAAPLLALGLPLFDTLGAMVRRFLERRSLFCPDAGHLHHRFIGLGLTHRRAVLLMYTATLIAAAAGMVMVFVRHGSAVLLFIAGLIVLMVFFRLGGGMRVRKNLALIKKNLDQQRERWRTKRICDNLQVQVDRISSMRELWTLFQDLAQKFNLKVLELQLPRFSASTDYCKWPLENQQIEPLSDAGGNNLTVRIPFRLGTTGPNGELYAEVPIHGNAELAADKVQHLSRLMDCVCARQFSPAQEDSLLDTRQADELRTPEMISVG